MPDKRLEEADLDREVQTWSPDKNDKFIGDVLSVEEMKSRYSGDTYPYLEVELDDGRLIGWHAAQTVAASTIRRKHVRAGDRLAVKYLGEHTKGYKDFRILVEREGKPEQAPEPPELPEEGW